MPVPKQILHSWTVPNSAEISCGNFQSLGAGILMKYITHGGFLKSRKLMKRSLLRSYNSLRRYCCDAEGYLNFPANHVQIEWSPRKSGTDRKKTWRISSRISRQPGNIQPLLGHQAICRPNSTKVSMYHRGWTFIWSITHKSLELTLHSNMLSMYIYT